MKRDIHPTWYPEAVVLCQSCGNTWKTGATVAEIRTEICSNCHPFYTGEQRIVDTEGRVDAFLNRLAKRDKLKADADALRASLTPMDLPIEDLGLTKRHITILKENNINIVEDILNTLSDGDEGMLAISGIGRQALADIKKLLRARGYAVQAGETPEA